MKLKKAQKDTPIIKMRGLCANVIYEKINKLIFSNSVKFKTSFKLHKLPNMVNIKHLTPLRKRVRRTCDEIPKLGKHKSASAPFILTRDKGANVIYQSW